MTGKEIEPAEDPFVIVDDELDEAALDDGQLREAEEELDGFRIRQLVHLRRSNIRSQTYAIVGMIACAVAATKLTLLAYHSYGAGKLLYPAAFGLVAVAAAIASLIFAFNADRLRAELKDSLPETDHEPSFELLSDGSHHVQNLHEMHEDHES